MDAAHANDVIVREGSRLWYLSESELLDLNIMNIAQLAKVYPILSKGIGTVFEPWNEKILLEKIALEEEASTKLSKLYKMLKSFFQMDCHCKLQVPDREVEIFWSKNGLELENSVEKFKYFIEKGPNVGVQVAVISMSLLLVAWSFYDLRKVFIDCNALKTMIESDKLSYVESLTSLEAILTQIINALRRQSIDIFSSHLQVLNISSAGIINRINMSHYKITNDIKELSDREFNRRIGGTVSALLSIGSFGTTFWNWDNWDAPQRVTGLIFGGGTAVSAVTFHMTANQLHEMQKTLKHLLTNINTLNSLLEPISAASRNYNYDENIEYTYLLDQFVGYKNSIEAFKSIFIA